MSSKDHKSSSKDQSAKRKSASHKNRESLPTEELKRSKHKDKLETGELLEKKRVANSKEEELAREKSTSKLKSSDRGEGGERRRPKVDHEEVINDKIEKRRDHHKSGRHRTDNLEIEQKRPSLEDPQNERGEHRRHKRDTEDDRKHHEKKQHKIDPSQDEERRRRKREMKDDKPEKERRERNEDGSRKHRRDKDESQDIHEDPEELEEYRRRKEEKRERRHRREREEQQAKRETAGNAIRVEPDDIRALQTRAEYADNYDDDFEAVDDKEDASSTPSGGSLRRNSGSQAVVPDSSISAGSNAIPARGDLVGSSTVPVGLGHSSFINFKIAHKRRCRDIVANAMLSRAFDLGRLIDMDRVSYDIVDVAPVLEHSQYMRLFGRAGCEHEASQTGDDNVGRDCQTEPIETRPGWTQCPSGGDGDPDCGCGDVVSAHKASSMTTTTATINGEQGGRMFELDRSSLARLTTLVETVLVEEARFEVASRHPAAVGGGDSRSSLSKGYNQYSVSEIPGGGGGGPSGCCCILACFPAANSNVFATVLRQHHSVPPASASPSIAVWNVSGGSGGPNMLLTCTGAAITAATTAVATDESLAQGQITCISFSPDAGPSHVVAGLSSGVIALWDLRERGRWSNQRHMPPAYMTACVSDPADAEQWCHRGPITALHTVTAATTSTSASQVSSRVSMAAESYQLLSLDSLGRLSVWLASVVPAIQSGSWAIAAGSLSDLNLRPGSRFRLSRVTSIELSTTQPDCPGFFPVMTCMTTDPGNSSMVYIGTGSGQLLRHHRASDSQHRQQSRVIGDEKAFSAGAITQIDFYPFFEQYLLAGYDDGLIRIFSVSSAKALMSFQHRAGTPVLQLRWSRSHPAVFLSLDAEGALCVWNVLLDLFRPALVQRLPGYIGFDLSTDSRWHIKDRNSSKNTARMLLWALDGRVEVHELADTFSSPELDDSFKTSSLFQSLL